MPGIDIEEVNISNLYVILLAILALERNYRDQVRRVLSAAP